MHFSFEYPYAFILLLLIGCIYKCPLSIHKRIFPHTHLFVQKSDLLHKEKFLLSLIWFLLVTALASPVSYDAKEQSHRKGRDLVFVIDTSGSMGESGYDTKDEERSKLEAIKKLIAAFIAQRYDDNVGVTLFGSYAFSSVPLTYDMTSVTFLLDFAEVGIAGENTAIGDGLKSALELLQKGQAKERVIILLSDGYQNSGLTKIADAIKRAQKEHVKIYTIGVGSPSSYDKNLLQKIAKDTNAKMFEAPNASALASVYNTLDRLEPSAIRSQSYLNKEMLFVYPLALAMLILISLLAKRRS